MDKKPKNRHPCGRKPKTKDYIQENPQTVEDPKTEKPQFSSAKTEKPNQTLAKSAKPKIPPPPSLSIEYLYKVRVLASEPNAIQVVLEPLLSYFRRVPV